ncbi:MAG: winged helix-turn-helix transcriptional regulator [Rhodospirillaceae bacterium]|nr:winged helix-turn-helix transcriptional regulator [Rhodospirillaceae bacterium]
MSSAKDRLFFRAKLFRGLGDPSRLAILDSLRRGPLAVGQIVHATGLTQSNASAHLRCLSECGLVVAEPDGRFVHYRLSDVRIETIFQHADGLLADAAQRVLACTKYLLPNAQELGDPPNGRRNKARVRRAPRLTKTGR